MKASIEELRSRWAGPRTEAADNETGFLRNLGQWRMRYRLRSEADTDTTTLEGDAGLLFHARRPIPAGTPLTVKIRAGGEIHCLDGVIVLVKEIPSGFRLGLWLRSKDDAARARKLEALSLARGPHRVSAGQVLSTS